MGGTGYKANQVLIYTTDQIKYRNGAFGNQLVSRVAHPSLEVLEIEASVETPHVQSFALADSREEGQPRLGGEGRGEGRGGEG